MLPFEATLAVNSACWRLYVQPYEYVIMQVTKSVHIVILFIFYHLW